MVTKFPIAFVCAQMEDGSLVGRPIPLWPLLETGIRLKSVEQMEEAAGAAVTLASQARIDTNVGEGIAFATHCDHRQVFVACGKAEGKSKEDVAEGLGLLPDRYLPGPVVNFGAGEPLALVKSFDLASAPGMSDYLAKVDRLGDAALASFNKPRPMPFGGDLLSMSNKVECDAEVALQVVRDREASDAALAALREKKRLARRYAESDAKALKAPLMAICFETVFETKGTFTMFPTYHRHILLAQLPVGQDWPSQVPTSPESEAALLASAKALLATALGKAEGHVVVDGNVHDENMHGSEKLLDNLNLELIAGRWVAVTEARAGAIYNIEDSDVFKGALDVWAKGFQGALGKHLGASWVYLRPEPDEVSSQSNKHAGLGGMPLEKLGTPLGWLARAMSSEPGMGQSSEPRAFYKGAEPIGPFMEKADLALALSLSSEPGKASPVPFSRAL